MPRKNSRSYRKKRYITRQTTPAVSPSQIVTMKYVDTISINPPTGLAASHIFSANGIFDPDITGTGHQPLGRDEWEKFYDHYTVIGAKCTAQFFSDSTSPPSGNAMVGVLLKSNTTSIPSLSTIMEQSNTAPKMLSTVSGIGIQKVVKGFSAKRFFGLQSIKDNRGLVGASFASNPSEQAYFHVYITPSGGSDDVIPTSVIVQIEYTCLLTERKALVAS